MKNCFFLGCVTGLAILVGGVPGLVGTGVADSAKVDVCHVEGTGATHIITIADPALPTHIAHGDHAVEPELCDDIDNDCDGEIDEGVCSCPCFTAADLQDLQPIEPHACGNLPGLDAAGIIAGIDTACSGFCNEIDRMCALVTDAGTNIVTQNITEAEDLACRALIIERCACPKTLTYTLRASACNRPLDPQPPNSPSYLEVCKSETDPLWQDTYLRSTDNILFWLDIQGTQEIIQNYYSSPPVLRIQVLTPVNLGRGVWWEIYYDPTSTSGETISCGRRELLLVLPVSGTQITTYGLYGVWTITVEAGGSIVASKDFTITQ